MRYLVFPVLYVIAYLLKFALDIPKPIVKELVRRAFYGKWESFLKLAKWLWAAKKKPDDAPILYYQPLAAVRLYNNYQERSLSLDYLAFLKQCPQSLCNVIATLQMQLIAYDTYGSHCQTLTKEDINKTIEQISSLIELQPKNLVDNPRQAHIKSKRHKFSADLAREALLETKKLLDSLNVPFFLVSGTLLGAIRENGILENDYDIDVGVFSKEVDLKKLHLLLLYKKPPGFKVIRLEESLKLLLEYQGKVLIDIFNHYPKEDGKIYHGGPDREWFNTPFDLVPYKFFDTEFLIPKNYDLYLEENYGNWKVPQTNFDSAFSTPNLVLDKGIYTSVFYSKMLMAYFQEGNIDYATRSLDLVKSLYSKMQH